MTFLAHPAVIASDRAPRSGISGDLARKGPRKDAIAAPGTLLEPIARQCIACPSFAWRGIDDDVLRV